LLFRKRRDSLVSFLSNCKQKKYGPEPEKNRVDAALYFLNPKKYQVDLRD
jgi:septin family protein